MKSIHQSSGTMKVMSILLALVCAVTGAVAQTNDTVTRELTLDDCIALALEHNFDVQIFRFNPQLARFTLAGSYGAYDPTFTFSGEHQYNLQPGGIDSQGRPFGGTQTDADVFNSGLQGMLPWGLNYNLGANVSDRTGTRPAVTIDPNSPVIVTNNFFDPVANAPVTLLSTNFATINTRTPFEQTDGNVAAITLSQPLLKNFWIDPTRYQIYANKKSVKINQEDFRGQLMTTITSVEAAYYNLASAEDFVTVQERALQLAEQLLTENKKRVEVGALAPLDEKQAESQAASSRATLLKAQASLATAQRVLKNLLSDNYTNEWANVVVVSKDVLLAIPQQYNLQESWRKGMAQNPSLVAQKLNLDIAQYNIRLQRNQLFPQVDVIGSYGYSASGQEYSDAFSQIGNQSFPFWSVGGQLTIPLSQRSARNNYKIARASQEQQALQLKKAEQGLLITIENDIANAKADFEQVDATRQATIYATEALEAEQKKLENGKSTSFEVLNLQSQLTTARANEISALANYNIALAQLAFDEGSTLERRKIMLNLDTLATKTYSGNYPPGTK